MKLTRNDAIEAWESVERERLAYEVRQEVEA